MTDDGWDVEGPAPGSRGEYGGAPGKGGKPGSAKAFGRRCVLAAAVLWSLSGILTKRLDMDPLSIAFYRSLFAGLALLPTVPRSRWVFRPAMVPAVLAFGAMIGLYLAAVVATTAANAIFLQCTAAFWMIPISVLVLKERLDRRSLLAMGLAAPGVAMIVLLSHREGQPHEGLGIALGLASGVAYAGVAVGLRGLRDLDPIWLSAVNNLGGALVLASWIAATSGSIARPTLPQAGFLAVFGVLQMAVPYALFARGLREIGAPEAGLLALLEPVLTPIWVVLFHGETPHPATIVGGLCLLAGIAFRFLPARPAAPARPRPPGPAP